ncbi:MAG: SDR family NAD(P)-dependent oxidoreductase [Bacteroidota bacterium]
MKFDKKKVNGYSLLELLLFPKRGIHQKKLQNHLRGKTILITGASFGIGEQLAYMTSFKETDLILIGRTKEKLEFVKEKIQKAGGVAEAISMDLRNEKQLNDLIAYLINRERKVDIFVSNAGKSIKRSILKSLDRYHDFQRTMSVNYHAPVKICLSLIPSLAHRKGHIINVSAMNVLLMPVPKWSAYQASKTAFDQWFRSVSPELFSQGISTSTVYLPLVRTRMIEPNESYRLMPAMDPNHVARIICRLLLSKKSKYKPWWTIFAEVGSFIFQKPIMFVLRLKYKNSV